VQANDNDDVFKAGVPISRIPDDGEWSGGKQLEKGRALPAEDEGEPVVLRKAGEAFTPEKKQHGEMCVAEGDFIFAFETLIQNRWVYGYKQGSRQQVLDQGWLPAAILIDLDETLEEEVKPERKRISNGGTFQKTAATAMATDKVDNAAASGGKGRGKDRSEAAGGKGAEGKGAWRERGKDSGQDRKEPDGERQKGEKGNKGSSAKSAGKGKRRDTEGAADRDGSGEGKAEGKAKGKGRGRGKQD